MCLCTTESTSGSKEHTQVNFFFFKTEGFVFSWWNLYLKRKRFLSILHRDTNTRVYCDYSSQARIISKGITYTQTQLVSGLLSLRRKATKSSVCAETTRMQMTIDSPPSLCRGKPEYQDAEINGCALLIVMIVCVLF